jgi:hypothetical protein
MPDMANFANLQLALDSYVKAIIRDPNEFVPASETQRSGLVSALNAYIDERIDEKIKNLRLGGNVSS